MVIILALQKSCNVSSDHFEIKKKLLVTFITVKINTVLVFKQTRFYLCVSYYLRFVFLCSDDIICVLLISIISSMSSLIFIL